jgi:hypothetical protein
MNRPNEFRDHLEEPRVIFEDGFERAFRPASRTGYEVYLQPGFIFQAED